MAAAMPIRNRTTTSSKIEKAWLCRWRWCMGALCERAAGLLVERPRLVQIAGRPGSIRVVLDAACVHLGGGAVGVDGAAGLVVDPTVAGGVGGDERHLALVGADGEGRDAAEVGAVD